MTQARCRLSVVVPVYNCAEHLQEALDSIAAQRHPQLEVLVVDDGSTDASRSVAERHPLQPKLVIQQNRGAAAARNRGVESAEGDILCFLDADDLWPAGKITRQLSLLAEQPSRQIVMGQVQPIIGCDSENSPFHSGQPSFCYLFGCAMMRRSVFETVGLLDESHKVGEDLDWFLRSRELGLLFTLTRQVELFYRQRSGSLTYGLNLEQKQVFDMFRRSIERRHRSGENESTQLPPHEMIQ